MGHKKIDNGRLFKTRPRLTLLVHLLGSSMSELAENTKASANKPSADSKPGDKIDPVVSQQQLEKPGNAVPTDSSVALSPNGNLIESYVSLELLGQPNALQLVRDIKKPGNDSGLAKLDVVSPSPLMTPGESIGHSNPADTDKPAEPKRLTEKELEKIAEAIDNAANAGFLFGAGTDKEAINEQLKRVKHPEDKILLDKLYEKRTGTNIKGELEDELQGSDLKKSLALWESTNVDVARVEVALAEHEEWGVGARTNATVERDLRDTISTLNSQQIAEMDREFQARNNGQTLREAFRTDPNLPDATKKALEIYLEGTDKRTTKNTLDLADLAVQQRNLDMFQEAFRDASPEARQAFLDAGGNDRILKTFGTCIASRSGAVTYSDNDDCKQARDYLSKGQLGLDTKIKLNSGFFKDNEDAIELAIKSMTEGERQSYTRGRADKDKPKEELSAQGLEDREFYSKINSALENPGDEREVKRWQDLIEFKDGSLVAAVTKHGGIVDDSIGKVLHTIENMSEDNWKRLKENPDQLKRLKETLAIDLSESEMKRANQLLQDKLAAESFQSSKTVQRTITESLDDSIGFFNTKETGVLESISKMTSTEQQQYRDDPEFKKKVDAIVRGGMDEGLEQKSAFAMLDAITRGDKPGDDILSKLYVHADHFNTSESKVIEDLEQAFKTDKGLRARLENHPEYRAQFDEAIRKALDPAEYEAYAKPIIENGRLPFAVKAELYQGVFNDDEQGIYEAASRGDETDFAEILKDPKAVLPFLSDAERGVVVQIAEQKGEYRPEDRIRAAMLGGGTTESVIHEVLKDMNQSQVEHVRAEYLRKYDSDMLGDTMVETGGSDREKIVDKTGAQPQTARESFNTSRDKVYKSVDGVGRAFVNSLDGTAAMTMDELNKYATGMSSFEKRFEEMPLEQRIQFKENLLKAKELYAKSEDSAADTLVDGAIIGAGVLGSKFTGGVSLSLLAYTSFGGALFKIGAKSAIKGNDYDFASADVFTDGGSGAIDAVSIVMGPTQAANFLRLGEKSAQTAATSVLSQSQNILEATGTRLLKEGSEEQLEKRIYQEVAHVIANGAEGVDEKVFKNIAQEFAASPDDVARVQLLVHDALEKAVAEEGSNALKAQMRELGLNSLAANVGGSSSGFMYGLVNLDESRSVSDNFYQLTKSTAAGGLSATFMAAGFTAGLRTIGRGMGGFNSAELPRSATRETPPTGNLAVPRQTIEPQFGERAPVVDRDLNATRRSDDTPTGDTTSGDNAALARGKGLERQADPFEQIIGDHDSKGKLWWPERHWDQLSQDDRSLLWEQLNGRMSPLSEPDFTFDFAERALPEFKSWTENFAPKFKEMKEYEAFVVESKDRFQSLQQQVTGLHIGNQHDQRRLLNEHFQDDHDNLTFINKWLDARDNNMKMHWELKDALEPRRQQIENLANSVVANYKTQNGALVGIPEVKVELVSADKMGSAVASYGDGVIRINEAELLNDKSVADLLGTIYHELTHNEQQSTIIRALADELKVGATISDTDMIPLKQLYKDRTGGSVSDDYMRRVIGLRNGVELPPEAASRANDLMDAFRRNKPVGDEWKALGNDFRVLQRDLNRLNGNTEPSIAYRIIMNLQQTRGRDQLARRLFGTTEIPQELNEYIKKFQRNWAGDDDAWTRDTEMAARKVFARIFEGRMETINNRRRDLYENYMQFHEYDAWLAGERARRAAIGNGASYRDARNSLWQEIDWLQ